MQETRVSLISLENRPGEIADNLKKMLSYIETLESDIICFPEACLTGYTSRKPVALERNAPEVQLLLRRVRQGNKTVIFGFQEARDEGIYVTQLLASPDRVTFYHKTHLGVRERDIFREGDALASHEDGYAVHGLALCWESHIPDIATALRQRGAEILWYPHAMMGAAARRREVWMRYLPARAYDNHAYVCACNCAWGSRKGGGLLVLDPRGNVLAESFREQEEALTVTLPALPPREAFPADQKDADYFLRRRPELYC